MVSWGKYVHPHEVMDPFQACPGRDNLPVWVGTFLPGGL